MSIEALGRVLRRDFPWVLAILLLALAGGWVATLATPAQYTATTTALYSLDTSGPLQTQLQSTSLATQRAAIEAQLVTTPAVLDPVVEKTGVDLTAVGLASHTTAAATATLLQVTVTLPSADDAARVATAIVAELASRAAAEKIVLDPTVAGSPTYSYAVSTVDPAVAPDHPSSPNVLINMLVALAAGIVAAAVFLAWRVSTDRRVYDAGQVSDALGAPVLGALPSRAGTLGDETAMLRTALLARHPQPRTVLLAPAAAARASVAARALAASFAAVGEDALLVEADARTASTAPGLTDLLTGSADADTVTDATSLPGVALVPVGTAVANAADLYATPASATLIDRLVGQHSPVVVVTAPAARFADAAVLGAGADAVLVLVTRTRDTVDDLTRAAESLRGAGVEISGAVWSG